MAVAKKQAKVAKKLWYPILATPLFNNCVIGETLVDAPEKMLGKVIPANLMGLTGDIKKQNSVLKFKVNRIENRQGLTEVIGFEIQSASIRRLVRRGKNKIDQSFVFQTSDGKKVAIKVLMITNFLAKLSVLSSLRNKNELLLKEYVPKLDYDHLIEEVVMHKLQSNIKKILHKIYPLRIYEIRHINLIKELAPGEKEALMQEIKEESAPQIRETEETDELKEKIKKEHKKSKELKQNAEEENTAEIKTPEANS